MKTGSDEEFLKHLVSKRKEIRSRFGTDSCLHITPAERERLYEVAERCGVLQRYEFTGVNSFGTSHNDAARRLLDKTRKRAFTRLKTEFGAKAHFWVKPQQFPFIDFFW